MRRFLRGVGRALSILVVPALVGCASTGGVDITETLDGRMLLTYPAGSRMSDADVCHALRFHVLDFNARGQLGFPRVNRKCFAEAPDLDEDCRRLLGDRAQAGPPDQRLTCHLEAIRREIERGGPDGKPYEHIVLIVHGGLVSEAQGLAEAITANHVMAQDCDPIPDDCGHYYPLFVVWRSGALPTYADQTTAIEQGERRPAFAATLSPLTIVSDLARGVVREPRFGASESLRLWHTVIRPRLRLGQGPFRCEDTGARLENTLGRSVNTSDGGPGLNVLCPAIDTTGDPLLVQGAKNTAYVLGTPLRMLTTPILLGPGQSAWENMQRRARSLVWRESDRLDRSAQDVDARRGDAPAAVLPGGVQRLVSEVLAPLTSARDRKLTLIGHSMGAIVLTEVLRLAPDLAFDNMVLMGAAVDMRSFIYALRAAREVRNRAAHVFNLSLHPYNEAFELSGRGTLPSGSLLEWIDEAYQTPPTQLDRVLGKWRNLPALERLLTPELAPNITFRMFGFDQGEPRTHGSFNDIDMCYWRADFWSGPDWPTHRASCRALLDRAGIARRD